MATTYRCVCAAASAPSPVSLAQGLSADTGIDEPARLRSGW